jgi:hypothetical protein
VARGKRDYQPAPESRELKQAMELLATHGPERAKYVVEFAVQEARETNFRMRTFGAILQYADEAARKFDVWQRSQRSQAEAARGESEQLQHESDLYNRAEERLKELSEEEYGALYERVKQDLLRHHSDVVRRFDEATLDSTVKAGMLRSLVEEHS